MLFEVVIFNIFLKFVISSIKGRWVSASSHHDANQF